MLFKIRRVRKDIGNYIDIRVSIDSMEYDLGFHDRVEALDFALVLANAAADIRDEASKMEEA